MSKTERLQVSEETWQLFKKIQEMPRMDINVIQALMPDFTLENVRLFIEDLNLSKNSIAQKILTDLAVTNAGEYVETKGKKDASSMKKIQKAGVGQASYTIRKGTLTVESERKRRRVKAANSSKAEMKGTLIESFFHSSIKDIYWAEKHLIKNLPTIRNAVANEELKAALNNHIEMTAAQVTRLEKIFELVGQKPQAKKCEAMEGLTKETASIIKETVHKTATRDIGMIMSIQKIAHYEIACYGGLAQLAKTMGMQRVGELLQQSCEEEQSLDEHMTDIAENSKDLIEWKEQNED